MSGVAEIQVKIVDDDEPADGGLSAGLLRVWRLRVAWATASLSVALSMPRRISVYTK